MNGRGFAFENKALINGEQWFLDFINNSICKIDRSGRIFLDIEVIERDKDFSQAATPEYGKVYAYENNLVIIPWIPRDIIVYDTVNMKRRNISYSFTKYSGMYFCEAFLRGESLYIIPSSYANILRVNMNTYEIEEICLGEKDVKLLAHASVGALDDRFVFGALRDNEVFDFDIEKKRIEKYVIPELNGGCSGVFCVRGRLYLAPTKTDIVFEWGTDNRPRAINLDFPKDYVPGELSFQRIIVIDDDVFFLPRDANMGLRWNLQNASLDCFCDHRIVGLKSVRNALMPISCVWKEDSIFYASLSERGEIVDLYSGKILNYEVGGVSPHMPSGLKNERKNRVDNLGSFIAGLLYDKF